MATEDQRPIIRVIGFRTTYDMLPKRGTDPLNDDVDQQGFLLDAKGRRIMERRAEDWAIYAPAHSPLSMKNSERVRHLIPDPDRVGDDQDGSKLAFMTIRWAQIEPAYEAWKRGHDMPVTGTPLSIWPGLNAEQVEVLRQVGLRSIEEVRDLSELQIDKVRLPNMRDIRAQARVFLDNMGPAAAAEREVERDRQMAAMQETMEELRAQLAARSAETPADGGDVDDEVAALRADLDAKGIAYDRRWAAPKLRSALLQAEAA